MNAARNDIDPERVRFDVSVVIEDISTGQLLLNETRPVEALDKEQMTAERLLNHCAREARNLIDGGHKLEAGDRITGLLGFHRSSVAAQWRHCCVDLKRR